MQERSARLHGRESKRTTVVLVVTFLAPHGSLRWHLQVACRGVAFCNFCPAEVRPAHASHAAGSAARLLNGRQPPQLRRFAAQLRQRTQRAARASF
eukprot:scaffold56891_cov53-Phaeocystis_antarctica.AAC.3